MSSRAERLQQEFWEFSCDYYQQPGVKELCLRLQDEHGFSVNLLLFCLWAARQQQSLPVSFFQNELTAFDRLNRSVLEPFRQKRRQASENTPWLKSSLLQMELKLERQLQQELVDAMLTSQQVQRGSGALAKENLKNYLLSSGASMQPDLLELIARLLAPRE